tara:strand:- start:138 stop:491 length:354 start_codon:yes stop_codon:yes gene_type:complete
LFEAARWFLLVLDCFPGSRNPESGNPVIAFVALLVPVTRNPTTILGWHTPDTTDPDVIFSLVVPRPVAWDPEYIFTFGFVFRGDFTDRFRRSVRNQDTGIRIVVDLFGKCLVDRTSC